MKQLTFSKKDSRLYMAFMYVTFTSLLVGGLMGLLQTLVRSGKYQLPFGIDYYTILTVHGVILGLVMTTFFIIGFQFSLMGKTVGLSDKQRKFSLVVILDYAYGTVMAAVTILSGQASVLYTFYAPLRAHPVFYFGLALVIIGSWVAAFVNFRQLYLWKKANKGQKSPLLAYHGDDQYDYVGDCISWRRGFRSCSIHSMVSWICSNHQCFA